MGRALVFFALVGSLGFAPVASAGLVPLDHFNVYMASGLAPPSFLLPVSVEDQFGTTITDLLAPALFMVPADKNLEGIADPFSHLICYPENNTIPGVPVISTNQFGAQQLSLGQSHYLCVPSMKFIAPGPVNLDHYHCYDAAGPPINVGVGITDQFQAQSPVLMTPFLFCNPADKNGEGIVNSVDHLTCYDYTPEGQPVGSIFASNQFFPDPPPLDVAEPFALCVPGTKQHAAVPAFSPVGVGALALAMIATATLLVRTTRRAS